MIARHVRIYDLVVLVLYGRASGMWSWVVRPLTGDDNYQIELANGFLYNFVSHRDFAETEEEAFREASTYAIRTARARVLPFSCRYLDRLVKIDLGKTVNEWTK